MLLFINYPSWLKPEIIPGLPFRWYGMMYMAAFLLAYILFKRQAREKKLEINDDTSANLFFWTIIGLLVGARVFSTLVYDQSGRYWQNPLLIFWPFDSSFNFTGLQGMSYHGGFLGAVTGAALYCRKKKLNIAEIGDMLAVAAPAGYTFGRLGNFINGELYGRVTSSSLGMIFPHAPSFPLSEGWVKETAVNAGIDISAAGNYINLPRHPSQLYEALFEGVLLWAFLWFFMRKKKLAPGSLIGAYAAGYGAVRFFIEYFREPDMELGFIFSLSGNPGPIYRFDSWLDFSLGQLLCLLMVAGGLLFMKFLYIREREKAEKETEKELLHKKAGKAVKKKGGR